MALLEAVVNNTFFNVLLEVRRCNLRADAVDVAHEQRLHRRQHLPGCTALQRETHEGACAHTYTHCRPAWADVAVPAGIEKRVTLGNSTTASMRAVHIEQMSIERQQYGIVGFSEMKLTRCGPAAVKLHHSTWLGARSAEWWLFSCELSHTGKPDACDVPLCTDAPERIFSLIGAHPRPPLRSTTSITPSAHTLEHT